MAISVLDEHAALVLIDLQKGIVGQPTIHPAADIIARAAQLAKAFRESGRVVALVNVASVAPGRTETGRRHLPPAPDWKELVPELDPQPDDLRVTKHRPGAFIGTGLDALLRQRGVTQIVLAGISTSNGVEATARSAYDYGYNVAMVIDAMTDLSEEAHRYNIEKVFPKIGETDTTEHVLRLLQS